jgi:hypothetical protein
MAIPASALTCCCCGQAEVFEEIATMDYPFEGIPTIPPRKNTTHMAAFCNGCRYRVTANPDMTVAEVWLHMTCMRCSYLHCAVRSCQQRYCVCVCVEGAFDKYCALCVGRPMAALT